MKHLPVNMFIFTQLADNLFNIYHCAIPCIEPPVLFHIGTGNFFLIKWKTKRESYFVACQNFRQSFEIDNFDSSYTYFV